MYKLVCDAVLATYRINSMQSDCAIGSFLGDVIYIKKINASSTMSSARVSFTQKDKSKPITNEYNVGLILKDMADQAMTALLTDGEMLQALKDYRLWGQDSATAEATVILTA